MIKNTSASVHQRLLNMARSEGVDFNMLLRRYFQERWLYRLSISDQGKSFILKGGMLLAAIEPSWTRPTRDLDFLVRENNDAEHVAGLMRTVCSISASDGVVFDPRSVQAETIIQDQRYKGVRVRLVGSLGQAVEPLQIDLGFSDVVVPGDVPLDFPTLLDMDRPQLRAYSRESVVAEKFECMVSLGTVNSRLKDFYDIHQMACRGGFDPRHLRAAIETTFTRRGTAIPGSTPCFEPSFAQDGMRQKDWERFLRRHRISDAPSSFEEVMSVIKEFLDPVCASIIADVESS